MPLTTHTLKTITHIVRKYYRNFEKRWWKKRVVTLKLFLYADNLLNVYSNTKTENFAIYTRTLWI